MIGLFLCRSIEQQFEEVGKREEISYFSLKRLKKQLIYYGIFWSYCQVYSQAPQPLRLSRPELTTALQNLADVHFGRQLKQYESLVLSAQSVRNNSRFHKDDEKQ
ncbi:MULTISPECIES: hypothetical protein [unclassified Thermosynechococcus]|uniref:hypothetical protein n=1 Tax=unclassified Thermosynechococcus TaxID=2622553 RepID=UPI0037DD2859